ncbi:MAG: glycosyltransferase family 4 protein [Patescibacteria group bacterium]|nr:glycosyltransferase family 4 protein [Patescibacteria group bacterium]
MKLPKVAIISTFFDPIPKGGAEVATNEIINGLKKDFELTIICARFDSKLPKKDSWNGVPVFRLGVGNQLLDKILFSFLARSFVKKNVSKFKIIHAILESYAGVALAMISKFHKNTILTLQDSEVESDSLLTKNPITQFTYRWIHKKPRLLTAISRQVVSRAQKFTDYKKQIEYIPNGVHLHIWHANANKVKLNPNQIIFWGRLNKVKGVDVLIKAISRLKLPKIKLEIIGDGPEAGNLRTLTKKLKLDKQIHFAGFKTHKEISKLAQGANIFVGMSRSEALGNVFIEAQATGCIPIGTQIGGIPDIITHGKTGFLVPKDDASALAKMLRDLLKNSVMQKEIRKNLYSSALHFSWKKQIARYRKIYVKMLSRAY